MKPKYNIGDKVFVYDYLGIKKRKITCIIIDKDGISYVMEDEPFYVDSFPKNEEMIASSIDELKEKIIRMEINKIEEQLDNYIKEYKKNI